MIGLDFESVLTFSIYGETFGNSTFLQYIFSELTIFWSVHDFKRFATFTDLKLAS